jgi:hypothetical protein
MCKALISKPNCTIKKRREGGKKESEKRENKRNNR